MPRASSALALIFIAIPATAADIPAQPLPPLVERAPRPDFTKVEIETTRLAADFYTLEGLGGTIE